MAPFLLLVSLSMLVCLFLRALWVTISSYCLIPMRIKKAMVKQGVHGPKPSFLFGNLTDISSLVSMSTASDMVAIDHDIVSRVLPHYVLWSKQYGKRFIAWWGSEPRLCLGEIDLIKEFLSSKYMQVSGRSWLQQQGSKHLIGRGLLMANGDDWFHPRHIVAPSFIAEKLKGHVGYMVECTRQMIESLYAVIESGDNEVEIGGYFTRLAGDIISRTGFGSSYEKGQQIFHLLTKLQRLTAQSSRHLCFPGSRFIPSKFRREIKALKMEIEKLMMEIIQSRKDCAEIGRTTSYGNDLLGTLLAESQRKSKGFNITLQLLMDECKTIFFAGHETTALNLTWTVMLLATNPSWQEKARAEVFQVCGRNPPSTDQLSKLTVLSMILNESLRLYPPVSILPRMAFEDIKLGNLQIPKGLSIWIPVLAIHHNKDLWGKDANEFNPDRFSGKSFAQLRNFMPFGTGPRNCVGQAFALMEAKIILAMLISNFSFSISPNYRHAPVSVLTLKPKHGLPIHLKPLSSLQFCSSP